MSPTIVLAGIIMSVGAGAVALVWLVAGNTGSARSRLDIVDDGGTQQQTTTTTQDVRGDSVPALTRVLAATGLWQELQLQIVQAGWRLRPSEFLAMSVGAGAVAAGLMWVVTANIGAGILLGLVAAGAPYVVLKARQQVRRNMLSSQLPDALDTLSNSLRSGSALLRAMAVVRSQMHPPISEEFGRVIDEVNYGMPVDDALDNLTSRVGNYDLELIVAAIQTQLTTGGNLAEIFDNIAEVIRNRVQLQGEIDAATAEGRLSAIILLALPFVLALLISLLNPGYLRPLYTTQLGMMMMGGGVFMMIVGSLIIRKLIDIDI